jgi:ribose 5-phosphate isomerase B
MVTAMTIALGADHAGFALKQDLKSWLAGRGVEVLDFGTHSTASVDYPDFAVAVGRAVQERRAERGVLVCGSGVGMAIAANKVPGIRAAVAVDVETARLCRAHNDTNVLTLGARITSPEAAVDIVQAWLEAEFEGGRHARRVAKLAQLEDTRRTEAEHAAAR